uniref:Uncharacterized protein n=1 Tax=Oryza sativa subsp. japonica TaxID=39947 RepID=Q10D04_ORYSJ|nr:hypothetical protein LOC_Os03g53450 [Oryza sativa Japonica Group]
METLSHETLRLIHELLPSPVDWRHMAQVVQMDSICLEFVQTLIVNQRIFMQQLSHRIQAADAALDAHAPPPAAGDNLPPPALVQPPVAGFLAGAAPPPQQQQP